MIFLTRATTSKQFHLRIIISVKTTGEFASTSNNFTANSSANLNSVKSTVLPPFSLIRDFEKQNTPRNVSKISVNLTCYRHVGSKSTNRSFRLQVVSPTSRFAYIEVVSPTRSKSFRLHSLSRFAYT